MPAALLWLVSACARLAPGPPAAPSPPAFAELYAALSELLQERRPLSALARLGEPERFADPEQRHALRQLQVRALFDAERWAAAGDACARFQAERPDALDWRPLCWEVQLEGAADRPAARRAVAAEIDALLAADPQDFARLHAAWLGHRARRDFHAADLLLDALEQAATTPDRQRMVAGMLLEALLATRDFPRANALARRYLAHAPDGRLADRVVQHILRDLDLPDLAAAREVLGLSAGPVRSWRIALALAEWALAHGGDPAAIHQLLAAARNDARPAALDPEPERLDAASRDWLWAHALTRLHLAESSLAEREGDLERALRHLRQAPRTDPPSAEVAARLGRLNAAAGEPHAALESLLTALARAPSADAERRLAVLLAELYGFTGEPRDWQLAHQPGPAFDDVTAAAGLDGVAAQRVAWGDADGDGAPDLLADGRLFVNDGQGRFVEQVGLLPPGHAAVSGGLWADVDGDGRYDLLLTGHRQNVLLLQRDGGWQARPLPDSADRYTEAAAFADIDADGDLDLYLANHERAGTRRGLCAADQLLINDGRGGFRDATTRAGIVTETPLCGRGVTWADLDADGRPDALVANYRLQPNLAWLNRGDGTFGEAGAAWGVRGDNVAGAFGHSIAVAAGDLDGDLREDLLISNLAHPRFIEFSDLSRLLLSTAGRPPPFVDRRAAAGIHYEESTADVALADVDNDGDLDLYITAIYPGHWSRLYLNDGHGRFVDRSWSAGTRVANGWGAAFADLDGDGALDLAVASRDGLRLLRNRGGPGHWLTVRVVDPRCTRDGTGSRVTAVQGERRQLRVLRIGRGTGSQDEAGAHFGFGRTGGPVEVTVETACGGLLSGRFTTLDRIVTLRGPE